MTTSSRSFLLELYREYLEEASFLYEQRLTLLNDPEVTWRGIGGFEDRFEAHIDGLVVGGELALEICKKQALEGDFGELHAAVRVLCRQNRKDLLLQVLSATEWSDLQKKQAIADALKYEAPELWLSELLELRLQEQEEFSCVLVNVFGYRRFKAVKNLSSIVMTMPPKSISAGISALGRLRDVAARDLLVKWLQTDDQSVFSAAACALMRFGEKGVLDHC